MYTYEMKKINKAAFWYFFCEKSTVMRLTKCNFCYRIMVYLR